MDKKVDFIGVGMPRAATTWLGECLAEHPDIVFSSQFLRKEINFFNNERYNKGIDWYLSLFPSPEKGKVQGEYSPTYFWNDDAAKRIKKHFPGVKLIISLRNPVDMIYSLYWYAYNAIQVDRPEDFDQAVKRGREKVLQLERGFCANRLQNFLDLFPKESILIIVYNEITKNPQGVVKRLYQFLEVNDDFLPKTVKEKVNSAEKAKSNWVNHFLSNVLKLLKKLGLKPISDWFASSLFLYKIYCKVNRVPWKYPPMDKETQQLLIKYYRKDIQKTAKLINRDLSNWLQV